MSANLPVWKMVRESMETLGPSTTNVAIRDWILRRYPGTNPSTIACQIIVCTVNHDSRVHYAENQKPRVANGPYDFLFRAGRGQVVMHDQSRDGLWEITRREDGRLAVGPMQEQNIDDVTYVTGEVGGPSPHRSAHPSPSSAPDAAFAAEVHLRDWLAPNLHVIEQGLTLFADESGAAGIEYATPLGRIDILAEDRAGNLVVIELKVGRGPDSVCGQLLRYKGWIKRHLAGGRSVRAIILAESISDKIRYALADDPEVELMEYSLSVEVRKVARL